MFHNSTGNDALRKLDVGVMECKGCVLTKNRHYTPFWTDKSKYVILCESPESIDTTSENKLIWNIIEECGFKREDFIILSTVQCSAGRNKKNQVRLPAKLHRHECSKWIKAYIKIVKPKGILTIGNVAMEEMIGIFDGVTQKNAHLTSRKIDGKIYSIVTSVSPSYDPVMFKRSVETLSQIGK